MRFCLPLSATKDLCIDTDEKEPFQIKVWPGGSEARLTKEETQELLELLLLQGNQLLQDLKEEK